MLTYQDLLAVGENDNAKMDFVRSAIFKHQNDDLYKMAVIADQYDNFNPQVPCGTRQQYCTLLTY